MAAATMQVRAAGGRRRQPESRAESRGAVEPSKQAYVAGALDDAGHRRDSSLAAPALTFGPARRLRGQRAPVLLAREHGRRGMADAVQAARRGRPKGT